MLIIKKIIYLIYFIIVFISYAQILHFKYFKKYIKDIVNNIQEYFITFYSKGFQSNIYYIGDLITSNDKIDILIGNHFNFIDFIIHIGIFKKLNQKEVTFLYSKYIDNLQVIGRLFRTSNSLSLNKKINLDIDNLKDFISKNNNAVIYLNPEGTRITYDKIEKSNQYSDDNLLPKYNNILFPKMKGIYTIIHELAKQDKLGNIIDFTVKVENSTKNDNNLSNYLTKDIGNTYVMINTYKAYQIKDYDEFKKWFLMIWDKKEEYLKNYKNYEYNKLNTKLKTSIKIITIITMVIMFKIFIIIYFKNNNFYYI